MPFGDGLAHLRHYDVGGHAALQTSDLRGFSSSYVNSGAVSGVRGFTNRLRHRRMCVNRADQFFDRRFERRSATVASAHKLGRPQSDHVDAQQLVVLLVATIFTKPSVSPLPSSPGRGRRTGTMPMRTIVAACFGFLLGQPDTADFRIAICAAGHVVVVDRPDLLSGNSFGRENSLCRRDMCQAAGAAGPS